MKIRTYPSQFFCYLKKRETFYGANFNILENSRINVEAANIIRYVTLDSTTWLWTNHVGITKFSNVIILGLRLETIRLLVPTVNSPAILQGCLIRAWLHFQSCLLWRTITHCVAWYQGKVIKPIPICLVHK